MPGEHSPQLRAPGAMAVGDRPHHRELPGLPRLAASSSQEAGLRGRQGGGQEGRPVLLPSSQPSHSGHCAPEDRGAHRPPGRVPAGWRPEDSLQVTGAQAPLLGAQGGVPGAASMSTLRPGIADQLRGRLGVPRRCGCPSLAGCCSAGLSPGGHRVLLWGFRPTPCPLGEWLHAGRSVSSGVR